MINLKINDIAVEAEEGTTILNAANKLNIEIPTLCYLKEINEVGSCRICVVEVKGAKNLVVSCVTPVSEGMEVYTDTPRVIKSRKNTLDLILSNHNKDCINCARNGNCELQKLLEKYEIYETKYYGEKEEYQKDLSTVYLERDNSKCILCNRCVATCKKIQKVAVIGKNDRGFDTHIGCAFEKSMNDIPCIACGQCILACPTGALTEKDDREIVKNALNNPNKHVIVAPAPSVRIALGEEFGMPIGTVVTGKMAAALRRIGFDKVFDINYGADLTIIEEGNEFIERLNNNGPLPLITSCSPGWIKYMETFYPELIPNVSSCKSPQQMFGAIVKSYYAKNNNIDPKDIFVVTIMPCTAKKFERLRDDESVNGILDIDAVLTTRELAKLIKEYNIDFVNLPEEEFDNPLGSGASVIFGASGGVMEAALRTLKETLEHKELAIIDFKEVRGWDGLKEATYDINGIEVKVAAVSGIANAKLLLERIKNKEVEYHFIEIMACPGGCINGGGQPIVSSQIKNKINVREERTKSIYNEDLKLTIRKAHQNPDIKDLYEKYLKKAGSEISHRLLHTKYRSRKKY